MTTGSDIRPALSLFKKIINNVFMLHTAKIFAIFLASFLLGTAYWTFYPAYSISIFILISLLVITFLFIKNRYLLAIFIIFFSFSLALYRVHSYNKSLQHFKGQNITGIVVTEPEVSGKSQKLIIREATGKQIEVYTNQFPLYKYGQKVEASGTVLKADKNYDHVKKLSGRMIYPTISVLANESKTLNQGQKIRIELIKIKKKLSDNVERYLPEPASGLVNGVIFGTKSGLSDTLIGLLIASGTIHIIALSGYNITLVVTFFKQLSKGLPRLLSFLLPAVGIFVFVAATAFSASVVRAAIIGIFLLLAKFVGRQDEPLIAILFSASLMAFENPYILLYDVGFQLSFSAFVGIIYLAPLLKPYFLKLGEGFAENIAGSLAASLVTWPILSLNFERFSVIAPISNIFILPFVPLLMSLGFILAILGLISPYLAQLFAYLPWLLSEYFFKTIKLFGELQISQIYYKMNTPLILFGYYLLTLEILIIGKKRLWKKKNYSTAL